MPALPKKLFKFLVLFSVPFTTLLATADKPVDKTIDTQQAGSGIVDGKASI